MSLSRPTILLVEDNEDDVFAMQRALRKAQITHPVQVISDGQKAVDYLSGIGQYTDRTYYPLPSLVFLDLKLPYVGGFDVLEWVRNQPALSNLPVVVLTGSAEQSDRDRAEKLRAHGYLVKPAEPQQLQSIVQQVGLT
jgi:CheY-like chemotaxis protein